MIPKRRIWIGLMQLFSGSIKQYRNVRACYLHSSKVLEPPVAPQVDEGIADGQPDSDTWHQVNGWWWQAHIDNVHAGNCQTKVVVVVVFFFFFSFLKVYCVRLQLWSYLESRYSTVPTFNLSFPDISGMLIVCNFSWIEAIPIWRPGRSESSWEVYLFVSLWQDGENMKLPRPLAITVFKTFLGEPYFHPRVGAQDHRSKGQHSKAAGGGHYHLDCWGALAEENLYRTIKT